MARVQDKTVRELRQRTGASLRQCRDALREAEGDLERAVALLAPPEDDDEEPGFDLAASLRNQFLIAMPGLEDDNFSHTVSLLCEHNDSGAIGLVINRPMELDLDTMLDQMGIAHDALEVGTSVYWGGPVAPERGFVLHGKPGGWDSSMQLSPSLYITTSRDILTAIGRGEGPRDFLVALGYAGWGAGQLESEILLNSWLNTPADDEVLFRTEAARRWQAATRLIGVDITQLAGTAGHA